MITKKQVVALKYMIFKANDGTDLSKRVLAFLIDQSRMLTREICLTLVDNREGYMADEINAAARGIDAMYSCNCKTKLGAILHVMGSKLQFSVHYGDFNPSRNGDPFNTDGQFAGFNRSQVQSDGEIREGMPVRYTFWLSKRFYSRREVLVTATRKRLELIDLSKPGLYPFMER